MSTPTIQVDCASCGTTYRLALPKVLVTKPHKSMSFRCNNCSYKFQIQPKEILEQSAVAKTLILVESDGLKVHDNLQSVADGIESGQYASEDLIRVYGQEWIMMGDEPTLSELFKPAMPEPVGKENDEEEEVASSTEDHDPKDRPTDTEDVALDFHEDSELSEEFVEESGTDWSEIDPFSETIEGDQTQFGDSVENVSNKDSEKDDVEDWFVEELERMDLEETIPAVEQTEDVDDAIVSDDFALESEDDWLDGLNIDESADVAEEIDAPTPIADESTVPYTNAEDSMASEFAADFAEGYSEPESYDDPSAVEDIAANLWEELDLEDSEEEPNQQSTQSESPDFVTEDTSGSNIQNMALDFEAEPDFTEEEQTIQSTKSEFLSSKAEFTEDTQISNEQAMFAEMEFDEEDDDNTVGYAIEGENGTDGSVESEPSIASEKQKKRLSFSNRVPEVQKVEKREVNQVFVFAGIIMFSIGVLGYVLWNAEPESQDFSGMEVNSNMLKEMEEPKDGLQENDNTDGTAPNGTEEVDGEETPSGPESLETEVLTNGKERTGIFEDPFPQVLPDVPEEGLDFANDKSPRALSREGYRALKDNKPDLALRLFELALKKDGDFADAVLGMGKTFQQRGEMEKAIESFCRHTDLPSEGFTTQTMVEDVQLSQSIVVQLGGNCDGA